MIQVQDKGEREMKVAAGWKKYFWPIFVAALIPAVIILASLFGWSKVVSIPIVLLLGLISATMAMWVYANNRADGSEWWQDDDASGWRGY